MKKNIIVYLLLCAFTSAIISSCSNQSTESIITSSESESITTTTSEATTETTEVTTIEDLRTQDVIDAAWEARLDYCGSGLDSIPIISEIHNEYGYILNVDSVDYPELAESVDSIFVNVAETIRQYSENPDNNTHVSSGLKRCDNRLISFIKVITNYEFHDDGTYDVTRDRDYITLDYLGNELELEDIITDYSYFMATIQPLLAEQYPEDEAVTDMEFVDFYMSYDSATFIYSLSVGLDSPQEQEIRISLGYREYADLFNPCYLPGDGVLIDYQPDRNSLEWTPFNTYDGYYSALGDIIIVMNYNEYNYFVACYIHETDNPDADLRYLYVLYDLDSGVEIASQELDEYVRNTQYILDFVGNNT